MNPYKSLLFFGISDVNNYAKNYHKVDTRYLSNRSEEVDSILETDSLKIILIDYV